MGRKLKQEFIYHVVFFMFFLMMCLSFFYRQENMIFIILFLGPVLYFIIKTIYSLILLLDSYKRVHQILIREYYYLFIIGFNMILISITNNLVYYLQSCIIILVNSFLKKVSKYIVLICLLISNFVYFLYVSYFSNYNLFYLILTFFIVNLFLIPLNGNNLQ